MSSHYIIIPAEFANSPDIVAATNGGARLSLDGTLALLEFTPILMPPKAITDLGDIPHYSNKSILEILRGPEWTNPEVMP